jgi:hypothetical protein
MAHSVMIGVAILTAGEQVSVKWGIWQPSLTI